MSNVNRVSIKIGGPAGSGVFTIGLLISRFFQSAGLNVVYTTDYPSLIKGGHNTCAIRTEEEEINAEMKSHDVLVALDDLTIQEDLDKLNKGGVLVCSSKSNFESNDYQVIKVDETGLLGKLDKRVINTIYFGVVIGLMGDEAFLEEVLKKHFKKKDAEVIKQNIEAGRNGFEFSKDYSSGLDVEIRPVKDKEDKTVFMSGNDAAAIGAIKAGVKFVGEYPMTPSTSFLHFMAAHELDYNITTKQTEDELAAINTAIGASVAGVRSMTATSGGGFALMNEGLGFAAIAEAPVVIFECMRGGPSTGLPTYNDQGDLKFVINSSQGEFPLIVVAPGDIEESFYESFNAFNLAEICQTPVVVLMDKHLAASRWTAPRFDTSNLKIERGKYVGIDETVNDNKRHEFTEDGISKRIIPGTKNGMHIASSYEHDETGYTSEDPRNHELMMEKREKKLSAIPKEWLKPKMYGPEDADLTIVGWGSTKGPVLDALKYLNKDGYKVNYMHFLYINPFDKTEVLKMLEGCKDTIILEGNFTAQLRDIIRERTGFFIEKTYLKYDARPFFFQEIYEKVVAICPKAQVLEVRK